MATAPQTLQPTLIIRLRAAFFVRLTHRAKRASLSNESTAAELLEAILAEEPDPARADDSSVPKPGDTVFKKRAHEARPSKGWGPEKIQRLFFLSDSKTYSIEELARYFHSSRSTIRRYLLLRDSNSLHVPVAPRATERGLRWDERVRGAEAKIQGKRL
jgi:hypothetical protein